MYILYISGDRYDKSLIIHVIISRAVMIYGSHEMRFITYCLTVNICIIKLDENVLIVLFEKNVT